MIIKYRKAFFTDLGNITQLKYIKDIEFITEMVHTAKTTEDISGFKWLRQ